MKLSKVIKFISAGFVLPVTAFAQGLVAPDKPQGLPGTPGDSISIVLGQYIDIFLAVVGIIAVGFLIFGGFRYITSAGNEEQAEAGKKTIQNALIGLVIIILSYVIVTVIINALAKGNS